MQSVVLHNGKLPYTSSPLNRLEHLYMLNNVDSNLYFYHGLTLHTFYKMCKFELTTLSRTGLFH